MVGDFNEAGGMHVVIRAKSGYPFQYGCAGDAAIEEKVDDARISWDPVMRRAFTQINGNLHCLSGIQHIPSLRNPTRSAKP
jgi:hypothetical protein